MAENILCVKQSLTLPVGWNTNNYTPAIQSYILLYQFCTKHPALYKIVQGSSHKSSYTQLINRISKSSEYFRKQEKHKLKPRKPKGKPQKATNSNPCRAARGDQAFASLPSGVAGTYFQHLWRKGMLPFLWNVTTVKHCTNSFPWETPKTATTDVTSPTSTGTHIWSLCGEAGPSPGAKEPKPT